jgi:16S rRNA (guanine966-N2)-methyltransferase
VRIISGKFKGHKLVSFDEDHIRPTTDRVKESVFNIMAPYLESSRVLDLFSGTGSLGLEAFSRGASSVEMVEINPKSIKIIQKNLERLKITEGMKILKRDAVEFVKKYDGEPYDVILIDPPFPLKICETILMEVSQSKVANGETRIFIEHSKQEPLPPEIGTLRCIDTRSYGDKLAAFYEKRE